MSKMLEGTTETGFKFSIDEKRLNNYELLEAIGEREENPMVILKVIDLLFGEEKDRLKDHIRDKEGIVDATQMMIEVEDVFNKINELKK